MAYSTAALVTSEFKSIDFAASGAKVTTAEITQFIVEAEAYIDGRIGLLYTTPVVLGDSPKATEILKHISTGLVAQRVAHIMETKAITPKGDQYIPKNLGADAERKLEMIVNRTLLLSDAESISSAQGVKSYSSSNTVTRTFKQGTNQW